MTKTFIDPANSWLMYCNECNVNWDGHYQTHICGLETQVKMNKKDVANVMEDTFGRLRMLREAGQSEYAHKEENAFGNFERVASDLDTTREKVLWTYLRKHLDGIVSYIKGHKSQRESIHGRIDDAHVYLELFRAMIIENGEPVPVSIKHASVNTVPDIGNARG